MLYQKLIRRALITAMVLAALCGLALVTLVLLMVRKPADYQPRLVARDQYDKVNHWGDEKAAELYNNIQLKRCFLIRFDQQNVNDLLMLAHQHPLTPRRDSASGLIEMVQVSFKPGQVSVMGLTRYRGIRSVLSLCFETDMTEAGRLRLSMRPVKMGALTIPDRIVLGRLRGWLDSLPAGTSHPDDSSDPKGDDENNENWFAQTTASLKPLLPDLFQNQRITLDGWIRDDLRLVDLAVGDGFLELTLEAVDAITISGNR